MAAAEDAGETEGLRCEVCRKPLAASLRLARIRAAMRAAASGAAPADARQPCMTCVGVACADCVDHCVDNLCRVCSSEVRKRSSGCLLCVVRKFCAFREYGYSCSVYEPCYMRNATQCTSCGVVFVGTTWPGLHNLAPRGPGLPLCYRCSRHGSIRPMHSRVLWPGHLIVSRLK